MADYNKATNFTAKDTLPTGNAGKIVKGSEIDTELTAISNAIASKADINSPTFTGTPSAPTATAGSNTTQIVNTAYVKAAFDTLGTMSTQNANAVVITGGSITGITDLAVADGGTGRSTLAANAVLVGNGTSGINSVAPGTRGNVLTSDGTSWTSVAALTSGTAAASTSGTSIDFTGIPSGVKRVTVMFSGVSTNGTSYPLIQIGSGSVSNTGYVSASGRTNSVNNAAMATSTAGVVIMSSAENDAIRGLVTLSLLDSNTWVASGVLTDSGTLISMTVGGTSPNLGGVLDRVRITTVNGTDTFDAGLINIFYE